MTDAATGRAVIDVVPARLTRGNALQVAYDRHGETLDTLTWTPRSEKDGVKAADALLAIRDRYGW